MLRGLDIRFALAQVRISSVINVQLSEEAIETFAIDAQSLGYYDYNHGVHTTPALFQDEPVLLKAWEYGYDIAIDHSILKESEGTQAEWEALTQEEKNEQWEDFHELCCQGVAEDMRFYRVLMNMHLVGHVGH